MFCQEFCIVRVRGLIPLNNLSCRSGEPGAACRWAPGALSPWQKRPPTRSSRRASRPTVQLSTSSPCFSTRALTHPESCVVTGPELLATVAFSRGACSFYCTVSRRTGRELPPEHMSMHAAHSLSRYAPTPQCRDPNATSAMSLLRLFAHHNPRCRLVFAQRRALFVLFVES